MPQQVQTAQEHPHSPPPEPHMSSAGSSSKGKEPDRNSQTNAPQNNQNFNSAARAVIEVLVDGDPLEDEEAEDNGQGQNSNAPSTPLSRVESNDSEVKRAYERCCIRLSGWTVDEQRNEISVITPRSLKGSSSCFISNSEDPYFDRPLVWKETTTLL